MTMKTKKCFSILGERSSSRYMTWRMVQVTSSEIIGSNGTGHGALANLLADQSVDVLICGGIGGGAQAALAQAGVELCAGASGNADQAVEQYLKGELVSTGANCGTTIMRRATTAAVMGMTMAAANTGKATTAAATRRAIPAGRAAGASRRYMRR